MFPRLTRKRALAAVGGLATAVAMTACLPADTVPQTVAIAGSDTTQDVMGAIAAEYNADAGYNTDPDNLVNILSQQFAALTVPGDVHCGNITYHTPPGPGEVTAPNGSGAGKTALNLSVTNGNGCIDIARSSSPPSGSDPATLEYYAYALDAVGWSSASTLAPAELSLLELQGIYNCTFTNWNQVGGGNGPIQRYWPQATSGTKTFFQNEVLGFDPLGFLGCAAPIITQENSGQLIDTNNDEQEAIVPYSMANMIAQTVGTQPDQRAGQEMGELNGEALILNPGTPSAAPNTAPGPVQEGNTKLVDSTPAYPGIRYVFNIIDNTHLNYGAAKRYVGFINDTVANGASASPLCDGSKADTILDYGFAPLDDTSGPNNLLGSACRLY